MGRRLRGFFRWVARLFAGAIVLGLVGWGVYYGGKPQLVYPEYEESKIPTTVGELLDAHRIGGETLLDVAAELGVTEQLAALQVYMDIDPHIGIERKGPSRAIRQQPNELEIRLASGTLDMVRVDRATHRILFALVGTSSCELNFMGPPIRDRNSAKELAERFALSMGIEIEMPLKYFQPYSVVSPPPFPPEQWEALFMRTVDGCRAPSLFRIFVDAKHGAVKCFSDWPLAFTPNRPSNMIAPGTAYLKARHKLIPLWYWSYFADAKQTPWLEIADIGTTMENSAGYLPPLAGGVRYVWRVPLTTEEPGYMAPMATVDAETGRVYSVQAYL